MQIDSYQLKTKYIVKNKNVGAKTSHENYGYFPRLMWEREARRVRVVVALNFKKLQQGQVQDLLLHYKKEG